MSARDATARKNDASRAHVTDEALANPFGEGAFRWVAKGTYAKGQRTGEPCVVKWFKTGGVFEDTFFSKDILAVQKAMEIVQDFNAAGIVDKVVRVNQPEVWTFTPESSRPGEKVLVEPYIENYQRFNSNSGWRDDSTPWPRVMQALSHFSYHHSGGNVVLCDLQGGCYRNGVILTDPVILSRTGEYGVTDLGPDGISNFFSNHVCNEYCSSAWTKPRNPRQHFKPVPGTSMIMPKAVPTRKSRPFLTTINDC